MLTKRIPLTLCIPLFLAACDPSVPDSGMTGGADAGEQTEPDAVEPDPAPEGDATCPPAPVADPLDAVTRVVFVDDNPGGAGIRTIELLDAADERIAELTFELDADAQVTVLASFEYDASSAAFRTVQVFDADGNASYEVELLNQDAQSVEKIGRLQQKVVELGLVGIDGEPVPTEGCGWGVVGAAGTCLLCGGCASATWGACAEVCGLACLGMVWGATCACTDGDVGCG